MGIQRPISTELTISNVYESCSNHKRRKWNHDEKDRNRNREEKQRGETWLKNVNNYNLNNFYRFLQCRWMSTLNETQVSFKKCLCLWIWILWFEVCNFHFLPLVYQHIGGIYVFLHDLAMVQRSQALQDLPLQQHVRSPML